FGFTAGSHCLLIRSTALSVAFWMQDDAFGSVGGGLQAPAGTVPLASALRHFERQLSLVLAKLLSVFATVSAHFASALVRPSPLPESSQKTSARRTSTCVSV